MEDHCNGDKVSHNLQSNLSNTSITWSREAFGENPAASGNSSIDEKLYNDSGLPVGVIYNVVLKTAEGCEVEKQISFTLFSGPKVSATASSTEICPGGSVNLSSELEGYENLETTLLEEKFNSSNNNWRTESNSTGGNTANANWTLRPNNYTPYSNYNISSNSGDQFYFSNSDAQGQYSTTRTFLISPPINTEGYSDLAMDFWQYYLDAGTNYGDYATVVASTDGINFQILEIYDSNQGSKNSFINSTVSLKDYIGKPEVYIGFYYQAPWGTWWAIDNVKIIGETDLPGVTWTSSTDPDWTSNEQNPQNIFPTETTIYTATYSDPDLECPGVATVEVVVRTPPSPTITANYCGDSQFIELVSDNEYSSYRWEANGEVLGTTRYLDVDIAKTYTLTVTDDLGCEGTGYISVSNELIVNGDFEDGVSGFYTEYRDKTGTGDLYPEGDFAVDYDAHDYHSNFYGKDHTTGDGKFMIINGHPGSGKVIWRQTIENIQPNTNYYFNAWGMNLNPSNPARLQFKVNGVNTGTIADLKDAPKPTSDSQVNRDNWVQFYSNPFWNSGNATTAVLEIVNLETIRSGNDFALDDISFGTLEQIVFEIDPDNNSLLCEGDELELYANIQGGRFPITFEWTGPSGSDFSHTTTANNLQELNEAVTLKVPDITEDMAGTYTLEVTDFYGCTAKTGTTEVQVLHIDAGEDQVVCSNVSEIQLSGTISGSTAGGTWSTSGSGTFSSVNDLNAVYTFGEGDVNSEGGIVLTLTSNDSDATCTDEVLITFNNSPEAGVSVTPVTCYGANDGTATVSKTTGTGTAPFTYHWEDENGDVVGNSQTVSNLPPTESGYTVTVTDANGCFIELTSEAILEPTELKIVSTSVTDVTCFGGNDGSASLEVSGGFIEGASTEYVLTLLDPQGNEVASDLSNSTGNFQVTELAAGTYTFTANTATGCSLLSENITVDQPLEVVVEAGEDQKIEQCGITRTQLNATPVDPNLGTGRWEILTPESATNATFADPLDPYTIFFGQAETIYELEWIVTPTVQECEESDQVVIQFEKACSRLNFDGDDDYIDAGNNFIMGPNDFSVEAWVKPNTLSGVNTIISKRVEGDSNLGYDLILNSGSPTFRVRNRSVTTNNAIGTDRWYHIVGVYTESKMVLYVDGIEIQTNTNNIPTGSGNFESPFLIGAAHSPSSTKGSKDHFHGFIEEVRIWEGDISIDQIRFFMNQRLKQNGTEVEGETLPQNLDLANAPALPPFSKLLGYYQLLAQENLITSGYTDNLGSVGNSADGLLKNIQEMQENTAPLPYTLFTNDGNWPQKVTWQLPANTYRVKFGDVDFSQPIQKRNVWNSPNSEGINGEKINWNIVKLNGNKIVNPETENNSNSITLLALLNETSSGELKMEGTYHTSGNELFISHYLSLNGLIDLNGESQLVQPEGSIISGTGGIEIDQQGTASSYNYNYWSSPVLNTSSNKYTVSGILHRGVKIIKDGETLKFGNESEIQFGTDPFFVEKNSSNDILISDYWIHGFFPDPQNPNEENANKYNSWKQIRSNPTREDYKLLPGEGFSMKGTVDISLAVAEEQEVYQNYTFKGLPNNGDLELRPSYPNQNYLIGNPYPSAIIANEFIDANIGAINGALYFWDHFSGKSHYLQEYVGGYAVRNKVTGVPAVSTDERINANGAKGQKSPGPYIPVGQGFFVNTAVDKQHGSNDNIQPGKVIFKNKFRVYVSEADNEKKSLFHSKEKPGQKSQAKTSAEGMPVIKLDFSSPAGYRRQIAVGADEKASNGFDYGYDAPLIDLTIEDMFWIIEGDRYVIQGVEHFNKNQIIPLGVHIKEEGEFKIEIAELENIPDEIEIYIRDKTDSTYFDLLDSSMNKIVAPGKYEDRFEVVFQLPNEVGDGNGDGDGDGNGDGW